MRPNLYQASRMLTTVGVTADIQFNPMQVTTRMRKSIQRQVETGNITGGWSSHASRLAKVLCIQFKLPYVRGDYWGLHVQFTDEKARAEAIALIRADWSAYILSNTDHQMWIDRNKDKLNEHIKLIEGGHPSHIRFYSGKEYVQLMRDLCVRSRTPSDVFNAKQVSNMLNQDSPIRINQHNWND